MSATKNRHPTHYFRVRLLGIALVLMLSLASVQTTHASVSAAAITLVKAIVASSAKWGIDKAGEAWMPGHWSDFKALVLSPLIKAYPSLISNENQQIETRKQAVREALFALENDEDLRYAILTRLENLEYGQEEIWNKVQILSLWLADHESRITRIESILGVPSVAKGSFAPPPGVADESSAIPLGSEGSATLVEYSSIVRKILQASRHEFRDIIKGKPYERNQYLKDVYNPTLTLPGAESCSVTIPTSESFSKSSSYHCVVMKSGEGYLVLGIKLTKKEAKKYPQAESWLQDALKTREPGQVYLAPPGMTVPTWEEALLAYLDTITRIRKALPPHWEEELPEFWESLREPKYWNGYKLKARERAAYHYKRERGREPPADWDSYKLVSEYQAKSPDGRSVVVYFSSNGPLEGVKPKIPRDFYLSVNFIASQHDRD